MWRGAFGAAAIFSLLTASGAQTTAQKPSDQQASPFQEQAAKLGVRKCANLFTALGQTVTHGSTYSVQTHADKTAPDARGTQAVIGMNYNTPEYKAQAAGVVIAAPVGQTCEGQMVRVAPFQQPCAQVVGMLPKGSTLGGNMSGVPLYNLAGNQGQALLVASGSSCVVVTVTQAVQTR